MALAVKGVEKELHNSKSTTQTERHKTNGMALTRMMVKSRNPNTHQRIHI